MTTNRRPLLRWARQPVQADAVPGQRHTKRGGATGHVPIRVPETLVPKKQWSMMMVVSGWWFHSINDQCFRIRQTQMGQCAKEGCCEPPKAVLFRDLSSDARTMAHLGILGSDNGQLFGHTHTHNSFESSFVFDFWVDRLRMSMLDTHHYSTFWRQLPPAFTYDTNDRCQNAITEFLSR